MNLSTNLFNNASRGVTTRNKRAIFLSTFFLFFSFFDIPNMHPMFSRVYFYFEIRKRFCVPQLYADALDSLLFLLAPLPVRAPAVRNDGQVLVLFNCALCAWLSGWYPRIRVLCIPHYANLIIFFFHLINFNLVFVQ